MTEVYKGLEIVEIEGKFALIKSHLPIKERPRTDKVL